MIGVRIHSQLVSDLDFDDSGRHLLLGSDDGRVVRWPTDTPFTAGEESELFDANDAVGAVLFDPAGRAFALFNSGPIVMMNTLGDRTSMLGHPHTATALAMAPDSGLLLSGSTDGTVRVWSVPPATESPLRSLAPIRLRAHRRVARSVAFSTDDRLLASASPNSLRLFVASTDDWTPYTNQPTQYHAVSVAFGSDDSVLVGTNVGDVQRFVQSEESPQVARIARAGPVLAVSASGLYAFGTSGPDNNAITLRRSFDQAPTELVRHGAPFTAIAFGPSSKVLAWCAADGTAAVTDVSTGKDVWRLRELSAPQAIAFAPNGRLLAIGDGDKQHGLLRIVQAETGEEVARLAGHDRWINAVAFHPRGHRIASASADNTVVIWDVTTSEALIDLGGGLTTISTGASRPQDRGVLSLAFSHDGTRLAAGLQDGTLTVWDTRPVRDRFRGERPAWLNSQRTSTPGSQAGP